MRSKYVIYAGGSGISLPLDKGENKKFHSKNMIYAGVPSFTQAEAEYIYRKPR